MGFIDRKPDIEAIVENIGTRGCAIFPNYRPHFEVEKFSHTSGMLLFEGKIEVGESKKVEVAFITPEYYPNCLWINKKVSIGEGSKIVGYATITKIYNEVLNSNGKKVVLLDSRDFDSINEFYEEIQKKLTRNLDWKIGHNLNALNDVLLGGFCFHGYEEPARVIWIFSEKSKQDFGEEYFESILSVFENNKNVKIEYFKEHYYKKD